MNAPEDRLGVKLGHRRDVRCTTALPPKAEVHARSCYVANVPRAALAAIRRTEDYGTSARLGSLRLDVGRSDDFGPFGNFRPDLESTLIGRIGNRLEAKRCHAL